SGHQRPRLQRQCGLRCRRRVFAPAQLHAVRVPTVLWRRRAEEGSTAGLDVTDLVQPGRERLMTATASSTPRRWLRQPVLHFALLGVPLFALRAAWRAEQGPPGPTREPIVIGAERVHQMEAAFTERWGAQPTAPQLRALVNQAVEEELLYREARVLALGF